MSLTPEEIVEGREAINERTYEDAYIYFVKNGYGEKLLDAAEKLNDALDLLENIPDSMGSLYDQAQKCLRGWRGIHSVPESNRTES